MSRIKYLYMLRTTFTLCALLMLLPAMMIAQAQKNLSLTGSKSYTMNLNDVWAWEDGLGREYALVGTVDGVSIVDLQNPASPNQLFFIPGQNSIWRDIKTHGNYAYVTNETGGGLLVIDLSGLPSSVNYKDTVINNLNTAHNLWIANGYAYVVGADIDNGGLSIFDVGTNPWYPSYVAGWSNRYIHDVYVRNDTAYAAEINDGLLEILDVSNKSNVQVLGTKSYVNSFTHNTWLNDNGSVVFTTDELAQAYIYAWDVTNPANITELDKIRSSLSNGDATPHNAHVLNDFIITSYYKDGIQIVDAARPHNLIETGYYDTSPLTGGGTDGNWGAYPFLSSGYILATDINTGLFVLGPTYQRGCYLEGIVTDSVTGLPINNASITFTSPAIVDYSGVNGNYATGVADSGTYLVTYEKYGYFPRTISVMLDNGVLNTQNIKLKPSPRVNYLIRVVEEGTLSPIPGASVVAQTTGAQFAYVTDGSGEANDTSFTSGSYDILAGKWGYITKSVSVVADSNNTFIQIELKKGYYDDFVFDFGWTVTGNASAGIWERGIPVGTDYFGLDMNPGNDVANDFGLQAYVTGNGGGSAGDDDVDGGTTVLTSPVFDATIYSDPVIDLYRWFANDGGFGGTPNDELRIKITNGSTTVSLATISGTLENSWKQDTFLISSFITVTNNMRLIVECEDLPSGHIAEGAIDKFLVREAGPQTGIEEASTSTVSFTVFPNPASSYAWAAWNLKDTNPAAKLEVRVFDVHGRLLHAQQVSNSEGRIMLPSLTTGFYSVTLFGDGEAIATQKLIRVK